MTDGTKSPRFFRLDIEAIEDLHTGAGTGNGDIDALVQRDRHGRPVIRASHFKGLLREAGEELIALGHADVDNDQLNALLGAPGTIRGALRMTSLRVAAGHEGRTLIWGSTKRVDGGRAPEEDTLRYIEHVAAGTHFQAQMRLSNPELESMLERLLQRIDRIGGDRNRGSGLVKLTWQPCTANSRQQPTNAAGARLCLTLRNLEPLCLPATGHPGNLIRGHSFIRGQTLRGALMAWAIHTGRTDKLGLFDRIAVGDALPLPEGITQADAVLPIPLSILTEKPKGGDPDFPWWAGSANSATAFDSLAEDRKPDEKPKRPGAHEYLCRSNASGTWLRYTPAMKVRLRNATPKRDSRADANLFSLEEIAEDTVFQTELRCDDEPTARNFVEAFAPLFDGGDWLAIGRGGQPVIIESIAEMSAMPQKTFADEWTLTLTSDLIVRGEHLGFLDNLDIDQLCRFADIAKKDSWVVEKAVVETEAIHGFNAVTGLQRAPALALRRGSCWRIKGDGSAALAGKLAGKAVLGERTREGLGRFLIDAQPVVELEKPGVGKAEVTANRNEELLSIARTLSSRIKEKGPSLSQLQWLREQALATTETEQLEVLLTEIENAPQRRPQGGKAWDGFPTGKLKEALAQLRDLKERRQLISHLVQWRVPIEKEKRK